MEKAANSAKWFFPKWRKCQIRQNGSSPNGESAKYGKIALPQMEKTPNSAKWLFPKRRKCQIRQNGSSTNGESTKFGKMALPQTEKVPKQQFSRHLT